MKVLIVGAGLGGLSLAVGLRQASIDCDVVDIGEAPVGANITINGQAVAALQRLGVLTEILRHGRALDIMPIANTMDPAGTPLIMEVGRQSAAPDLPPALAIYRPSISKVLRDRAEGLGAHFKIGPSITAIGQDGRTATATSADGEEEAYDLVVGADGLNSITRQLIHGDRWEPIENGWVIVRWVVKKRLGAKPGIYLSPLGGVNIIIQPGEEMFYLAHDFLHPNANGEPISDAQVVAELRRSFAHFSEPSFRIFEALLDGELELLVRPYRILMVDRPWHVGRVTLLGDAAHTPTPYLSSGGGMAIEDAVVLVEELLAHPHDVGSALDDYEERRFDRNKRAYDICNEMLELSNSSGGSVAATADARRRGIELLLEPY